VHALSGWGEAPLVLQSHLRIGIRDNLVGRTSAAVLGRTDFRANSQLAGCDGAIMAAVVERADSNIFAEFPWARPVLTLVLLAGIGPGFGYPTEGRCLPRPS